MLSLNLKNSLVQLIDIIPSDIYGILSWYNEVDSYQYATGVDKPLTLGDLTAKYNNESKEEDVFFAGIYGVKEQKMIGIIKGRLQNDGIPAVWISMIVIDFSYQHKGYGRAAVTLLLEAFKINHKINNAYLAVVEENIQGRRFWKRLGFCQLKKIDHFIRLHNKEQNILIMYKKV